MKRADESFVDDIMIAASSISDYVRGVTMEDFLSKRDAMIQDAVIRHGFEEGRDARVFARMNSEGEGEIHIVGADAEARAAIKAVIETARKVHVVEHEIAKPELDAAKRVQSAWAGGNLLPPRRPASSEGAPPRDAAMALPTHEDDVDDDRDSSSVRPGRGARRRTGGEP